MWETTKQTEVQLRDALRKLRDANRIINGIRGTHRIEGDIGVHALVNDHLDDAIDRMLGATAELWSVVDIINGEDE